MNAAPIRRIPRQVIWQFWGRFTYCAETEPDSYPECKVPEATCDSGLHMLTMVVK
jgi:hypothetical protein